MKKKIEDKVGYAKLEEWRIRREKERRDQTSEKEEV